MSFFDELYKRTVGHKRSAKRTNNGGICIEMESVLTLSEQNYLMTKLKYPGQRWEKAIDAMKRALDVQRSDNNKSVRKTLNEWTELCVLHSVRLIK